MEPLEKVLVLPNVPQFLPAAVPSSLILCSEYSAECFNRRAFISGFTGSAGTAIILTNEVRSSLECG